MGVDHCGLHIAVAQQFLDRADVGAPLQEQQHRHGLALR